MEQKIWFTSDTHFRHVNVVKHCPWRAEAGGFDINDIEAHDKWIKEIWNETVGRKDIVYILGDFSFANRDATVRLLHTLHGQKHLILGNHDKSSEKLDNMFQTIYQIRNVVFKKNVFPYLDENFDVSMCHYPLVSWNHKFHGAVMIHGHCHGRLDDFNTETKELRVDVGFDGKLGNFNFIELRQLYEYFKEIASGKSFAQYTSDRRLENGIELRNRGELVGYTTD